MNIVFTCGGTGGHIYPAIAVARMFRERQPDCRILFIGAEDGMENKLVPREGFELQTVQISNYQRKLTPAAIWHNLVTVQRMSATFAKTKRILKDFQPDVIVGTGGYASFPALKMGAKLGIPTCVHESNAVPGLTTKLVARTASRIMVSFDASRQHYPDPEKVLLTPAGPAGTRPRRRALDRLVLGQPRRAGDEQEDRAVHALRMRRRHALPSHPRHRLLRLALDAGLRQRAGRRPCCAPGAGHAGIYL